MTSRLFEYEAVEEAVLVDRILARVHKAVDEAFPKAMPATSKRFAKTVFADEPTVNQALPQEARSSFNLPLQDHVPETKDQIPITLTHQQEQPRSNLSIGFTSQVEPLSQFTNIDEDTLARYTRSRKRLVLIIAAFALSATAGAFLYAFGHLSF